MENGVVVLAGLSSLGSGCSAGSVLWFFVKRELQKLDAIQEAASECRIQNAETFATKEEVHALYTRLNLISEQLSELRGRLSR